MASILEKAREAANAEAKKITVLIFIGVLLLLFGVVFGVPITLDVNLGRVLAVLGFILTLIGAVGAIITYYEAYNDYLMANVPALQSNRVMANVTAPKVHMLEEVEEVVKPPAVKKEDLQADAPLPEPKAKQPRRQKHATIAP